MGAEGAVFFGDRAIFEHAPLIEEIVLPAGAWELAILPIDGWPSAWPGEGLFRLFGLALAALLGWLFIGWLFRPFNRFFNRSSEKYQGAVSRSLSRRGAVFVVYLVLLAATGSMFKLVPPGFVPETSSSRSTVGGPTPSAPWPARSRTTRRRTTSSSSAFATASGSCCACWIACKAGQTAKRLERILFGGLSSLTPFTHSPKIRSVFI